MGRGVDNPQLRERLGVSSFEQRWPWIGGDLQTLRDTLREVDLPHDQGVPIEIPVPALPSGCLLYTSPSPRDLSTSRMPSSA